MPLRPLVLFSLLALLAACAAAPPAAPQAVVPPAIQPVPPPPHLRELSGRLHGAPAGSEVELALLVVDEHGIPLRLLASLNLGGSGAALSFHLIFNPESFPRGARVELRGRASQSGWLILRLPPLLIHSAESRALGELRLVPAP